MKSESPKTNIRETREKARIGKPPLAAISSVGQPPVHGQSVRSSYTARILSAIALSSLCLTGCVSKSKAKLNAQAAYLEGQQKVLAEQQAQLPAVWFRGDIRNPRIGWAEGLTLSQALLSADYTWNSDPRLITVTRNGEIYTVNSRLLLRGIDDPVLEPGDIVEVRH